MQRKKNDEIGRFKASVESMVEDFEALKIENKRIVEQTAGKTKVKVIERATAATMTMFPEKVDIGTQFTEQYQENEC